MTIGSEAIGRTPNDLEISNSIGVGTSPSDDSVAVFKAGFTKQLPNLATSNPVLVGGLREITSVGHGLEVGSPVRIPSGAGGAFEDREIIFVDSVDIFRLFTDITNQITDKQILNSPDLARFDKPLDPAAFGTAGINDAGDLFFGKVSVDDMMFFRRVTPAGQPSFFTRVPSSNSFNFDMLIGNGSGSATYRFFRQTVTTGGKSVTLVHETGSGSTTHIKLGINGQSTFFHPDAGNFGIGTTGIPPSHRFEVDGDTKLGGSFVTKRIASGAGNLISTGAVILAVTDTSAPRTVTIQSADILNAGQIFIVQDEDDSTANDITVKTEDFQTINGSLLDETINTLKGNIVMYSTGANLIIISRK